MKTLKNIKPQKTAEFYAENLKKTSSQYTGRLH